MAGIPISQVVSVTPSALTAAGGVAFINGLIITENAVVPAGTVVEYTTAAAVTTAFGATSTEAQMAAVYFSGYTGANETPSKLYFAGFASGTAFPGYLSTLIGTTQDFAGFTTAFEPVLSDKQAIATWASEQADRFWYAAWDTDAQATTQNSTEAFGVWLTAQSLDGTSVFYKDPLSRRPRLAGWPRWISTRRADAGTCLVASSLASRPRSQMAQRQASSQLTAIPSMECTRTVWGALPSSGAAWCRVSSNGPTATSTRSGSTRPSNPPC
ncbi:DUF3383 family protein [Gluconobacter kondonii]|nr:DUF3383 family protein [Gluconobacter kondonii]